VFAAVIAAARVFGRRDITLLSVFVVAIAAAVVLWFPTFPAMGGREPRAVPIGFVGPAVAVGLKEKVRAT